jgi:hypothetical protein
MELSETLVGRAVRHLCILHPRNVPLGIRDDAKITGEAFLCSPSPSPSH